MDTLDEEQWFFYLLLLIDFIIIVAWIFKVTGSALISYVSNYSSNMLNNLCFLWD